MELKYISVQPASDYFAWQTEVYLRNFLSLGIQGEDIHVLGAYDNKVSKNWVKLTLDFPTVNFFFYRDTRENKIYQPSIQAHVLRKHFTKFRELESYAFFFHDCDFTFTKKFDFSPFLNDNLWYFSDTISYIGANYIKSKSTELFKLMCEMVGIEPSVVESNQLNSGGAQKLMKNLTADYWKKVEQDSVNLFTKLPNLDKYKTEEDPYPLQIWCASMWSELWNAWLFNHEVRVPSEFDFCWAPDPATRWHEVSFFHNAGVTNSDSGLFFKGAYINKLPYGEKLDLNKDKCSYLYFNQIKKAARYSTLKM
jgi:hypothetical protein